MAKSDKIVRPLALLTMATTIGSLGLAAGGLAGGLLAVAITGDLSYAGWPLGLMVAGSALSAVIISYNPRHRNRALSLAYIVGAMSAALVIAAAGLHSFVLLLLGSIGLGAANAALFLTRYVAAAITAPEQRGRALGGILFATAAGAIIGPNLLGPCERIAAWLGLAPYTGLYLVAVPCFGIAGLLLAWSARALRQHEGMAEVTVKPGGLLAVVRSRPTRQALVILAGANLIMVAVMAVAPIHLTAHGSGLGAVGLIIGLHITGMFIVSPLSGWLADRFGGLRVAMLGMGVIVASGLIGIVVSPHEVVLFTASLILLGLGWNGAVVGGSLLLARSTLPAQRVQAEGAGELVMGLAAAAGAPAAGLIVAHGGVGSLWMGAGVTGLCILLILACFRRVGVVRNGT